MLLLIKSVETAEPCGKGIFRSNFTFNLHYRVLCRSLKDEGQRRDPMIGGRGEQTLGPLYLSGARHCVLPSVSPAHSLPAARGPPLPRGRRSQFPPDTPLGQAVGAALAQLIAESHPGQERRELNMTERTPVAARCKSLSNFHYGHCMTGTSPRRVLRADGGVP
jgi:hypothetical protein